MFVTSVAAEIVQPGLAHYAAAKGGVRQLMRAMALELAPGVRVNAVAPGITLTPGNQDGLMRPGVLDRTTAGIPMGRVADPSDIAEAAMYLLGDAARYTTGTTLAVDGGLTLQ